MAAASAKYLASKAQQQQQQQQKQQKQQKQQHKSKQEIAGLDAVGRTN
eukprot:COSAG05_NODE_11926_length_490_cov_0.925831_1_plen_47_part_10